MTETTAMMAASELPEGVTAEDEPLPFLSNFQDVFLSMGVIILLVGVAILSGIVADNLDPEGRSSFLVGIGLSAGVLVIVSFLSEILVRARRRILPGIVLSIVFVMMIFSIFTLSYGYMFGEQALNDVKNLNWTGFEGEYENVTEPTHALLRQASSDAMGMLPWSAKAFLMGLPIAYLVGSFLYYRRYRLPFASAMVASSAIGVVIMALLIYATYDTIRFAPTVSFITGLIMLVAGIVYDMKDPERVTRFSGNGFWMHLFAAPAILTGALMMTKVGPAFDVPAMMEGEFDQFMDVYTVPQAVVTLVIIGIFALISLLLNRRALVVSGLISAGIAIGVIVNATGIGAAGVAATTLIVLGAGILLLGVGWHAARRVLLVFVPAGGIFGKIFPRVETDG